MQFILCVVREGGSKLASSESIVMSDPLIIELIYCGSKILFAYNARARRLNTMTLQVIKVFYPLF